MAFSIFTDPLINQGRQSLQKLAQEKDEITNYEIVAEGEEAEDYINMLFEIKDDSRDYQIIVDVLREDRNPDYHINSNSWENFAEDHDKENHRHSNGDTATLNNIYGTILEEYETITAQLNE